MMAQSRNHDFVNDREEESSDFLLKESGETAVLNFVLGEQGTNDTQGI